MNHVPAAAAHAAPARITLLTDFGTRDGYVAAMKGVIASLAPHVVIDDASHDIPPGDVHAAAWSLATYWNRYPAGTVHICVVDPGVGSSRRALAVIADGRFFVGPDNGIFTRVLAAARSRSVYSVENRELLGDDVSATFHGRDVFAPVAASIALGMSPAGVGPRLESVQLLDLPAPYIDGATAHGEIVHVDRFGNLITNIARASVTRAATVEVTGSTIPVVRTYADAAPGSLCALVGSADVLEISVRDGSAAERLGLRRGDAVTLRGAQPATR